MRSDPIRRWLFLGAAIALLANALGIAVTQATFGAMGGVSDFAIAVRQQDLQLSAYYNMVVFPGATAVLIVYLWPVLAHFSRRTEEPPSVIVQRRVVGTPLFVASVGLVPWVLGCLFFPLATHYNFGHWSRELLSQQVLSPLVSGFLVATTTYLLLDWLSRSRIVPLVFPHGHLADVSGALVLGVRTRFLVFLMAVAFTPLFTMLGLIRAAVVRVEAGVPVGSVVPVLERASAITFVVYVGLGMALTLLLARTLTRPLREVAAALRRVQAGDVGAGVAVTSSDEVGVLQEGVNAMVATLREREHILQTFGRVVEPSVRDQLLSGELRLGGELRIASVLFCDLRGFTALAEHTPPAEVVSTLNQFFSVMTSWVRECEGFVDKFIGDAILVVFGLFDTAEKSAAAAAAAMRCGLGVRDRLRELNAARAAAGAPQLTVAVSIHTGEVLAGRIGAEDRHEYTVIGDTVNVAARLQQLCKERGRDVLVSEATYELARSRGLTVQATMQDTVNLRGRGEPVRIYAVA